MKCLHVYFLKYHIKEFYVYESSFSSYPPTHILEWKTTKTGTAECKKRVSKVENFACYECEQPQKSSHTSKIRSKNQAKKNVAEREGLGWEVPNDP